MRLRGIRHRKSRHTVNKGFDLLLTPLLDVLVIILVYLLKSYDATSIDIFMPKGTKLAMSTIQAPAQDALMVLVAVDQIIVGRETVVEFKKGSITEKGKWVKNPFQRKDTQDGGRLITPLYDALKETKEKVVTMEAQGGTKFSGIINLVSDKRIPYELLKKVMYTAAHAGYITFKLAVQKEPV